MINGIFRRGNKGVRICVELFSDYEDVHKNWTTNKWSYGYSIQSILLNLIIYLEEFSHDHPNHVHNIQQAKTFKCPDCGHTDKKPFPSFVDPQNESDLMVASEGIKSEASSAIVDTPFTFFDFVSKKTMRMNKYSTKKDVIGFGIYEKDNGTLLTSGELISAESYYDMVKCNGCAMSSTSQELIGFIPCIIDSKKGSLIQDYLRDGFSDIIKVRGNERECCFLDSMTNIICELITNTLREPLQGINVSDNMIQTVFALYHLLMWLFQSNICIRESAQNQWSELEHFVKDTSTSNTTCIDNVFLLSCITELRLVTDKGTMWGYTMHDAPPCY